MHLLSIEIYVKCSLMLNIDAILWGFTICNFIGCRPKLCFWLILCEFWQDMLSKIFLNSLKMFFATWFCNMIKKRNIILSQWLRIINSQPLWLRTVTKKPLIWFFTYRTCCLKFIIQHGRYIIELRNLDAKSHKDVYNVLSATTNQTKIEEHNGVLELYEERIKNIQHGHSILKMRWHP